ncbi:Tim44-like domain protein [Pseudovibrio sp. W64]|jgi:predicted lipid-binding transport protein (Tim44 family)|uniref:Predicted lipid-binding transport protein, Tim44 family n=1 Tax=Pseudovibrio ascidiaceicola TaxID=285279 RepID=A0A1I3VEE6_9HYPH|nr:MULTISPECIES: Tim44/TimA family putative adaptor protein [Pseudovibrio]KZK84431.1 Tim44-like domain protein [Pseudovibrio sp. W64]KZK87117.1 Tim44-like domain protein [Pseudovibrio sp. Ad13]KZK96074.1 Tim44-like domain protein [Pseudovibrio sp. Ad5]KZL29063.1 Tim44-like domain protein [Pseudovibrio sp. WM33]KZL29117.1 Tim44-like domain protein [Pseudovibrio sp. Ad37]
MNEIFDVYNIIFLIAAVVIFLRLRSVLGNRTGNERQPFDPYSAQQKQDSQKTQAPENEDNVIPLPGSEHVQHDPERAEREAREQIEAEIDKLAKKGSELNHGLREIWKAEPSFNPKEFAEGARGAYEIILMSFAQGDRRTLKELLSPEVFSGFSAAIDDRESRNERVESTFVGIDKADIVEAVFNDKDKLAEVTVRFKGQLITATRDSENRIVDGDPTAVSDLTDIWTFARVTGENDPNWKLVATESA